MRRYFFEDSSNPSPDSGDHVNYDLMVLATEHNYRHVVNYYSFYSQTDRLFFVHPDCEDSFNAHVGAATDERCIGTNWWERKVTEHTPCLASNLGIDG